MALEFYSPAGTFERYQLGQLVVSEADYTYRAGGLRFARTEPGHWIMFGNLDSGDVESHATERSLVFVERSPINAYLHVLTIQDEWIPEVRGFRASYVRSLNPVLGGERMVSRFEGYVKAP